MRISFSSLFVHDQDQALQFYTDVLGFVKKNDVPLGEFRWLTVVSPEAPDGVELVLEPNNNPAARSYQQALYEAGIPLHSFGVDHLEQEVQRLKQRGVRFTLEPTSAGPVIIAQFDDTCGNTIQLHQVLPPA